MKTTIGIIIGCLVAAIVCTVFAEKAGPRWGSRLAAAALLAMYGVCVGIVATLLVYFCSLGVPSALLLGLPLGARLMLIMAFMAQ